MCAQKSGEEILSDHSSYDLKSVKLLRLTGSGLRVFVRLLESPATRWLLIPRLLRQGGIVGLRELVIEEEPTFRPHFRRVAAPLQQIDFSRLSQHRLRGFAFTTVGDYAEAYRSGAADPERAAKRVLQAIADSNVREPPLLEPGASWPHRGDRA